MKIKSVTIDLDGTLLDTVPDLAAAANAMLRELGRPNSGRGNRRLHRPRHPEAGRALPARSRSCGVEQAQAVFRRHYAVENGRRSTLFPGVLEGLRALRDAGLPLAVITNKAAAFTEPLLVATGSRPGSSSPSRATALAHKKPHPAQLLHACERMGTSPAENLHIGDSQPRCRGGARRRLPGVHRPLRLQRGRGRARNRLRCYSRVAGRSSAPYRRRRLSRKIA
jgi:phosphoglycolate phosphatase